MRVMTLEMFAGGARNILIVFAPLAFGDYCFVAELVQLKLIYLMLQQLFCEVNPIFRRFIGTGDRAVNRLINRSCHLSCLVVYSHPVGSLLFLDWVSRCFRMSALERRAKSAVELTPPSPTRPGTPPPIEVSPPIVAALFSVKSFPSEDHHCLLAESLV